MNKRVHLASPQPCREQGEPEGSRGGQRDGRDTTAFQKRKCLAVDLVPEGKCSHRPGL